MGIIVLVSTCEFPYMENHVLFFCTGKTMIGKKLGMYRTQNLLQTDLLCIDISERSLDKSGYLVCFLSVNFYVFSGVMQHF